MARAETSGENVPDAEFKVSDIAGNLFLDLYPEFHLCSIEVWILKLILNNHDFSRIGVQSFLLHGGQLPNLRNEEVQL